VSADCAEPLAEADEETNGMTSRTGSQIVRSELLRRYGPKIRYGEIGTSQLTAVSACMVALEVKPMPLGSYEGARDPEPASARHLAGPDCLKHLESYDDWCCCRASNPVSGSMAA
jgi:hypothetical protein